MTFFEWLLGIIFLSFYFMCLFTVCLMTFRKGYFILAIIGIFLPFLWLIGAFLPAKPGSQFDLETQQNYMQQA